MPYTAPPTALTDERVHTGEGTRMPSTLLVLTNAYPYFPGEQFIEDEIRAWSLQSGLKIVVAPMVAKGLPRNVPVEITIDLTIARGGWLARYLVGPVGAFASSIFWREVAFIVRRHPREWRPLLEALKSVVSVFRVARRQRKLLARYPGSPVIYCYWNDIQAYAAALMKREKLTTKVASRVHGYDLFEERRPGNYMPLKRQFANDIDLFFATSVQGRQYLINRYAVPEDRVIVSPLGVRLPSSRSSVSDSGKLSILSVANCVQIKRIDRIIDALAAAAARSQTQMSWTHIGGGPLLGALQRQATEKLRPTGIKWCFLGEIPNIAIRQYLEANPVDLFLNTSESEGVPVSIMEAMSYGVPSIAPDIGGVSELVNDNCGRLLSRSPSTSEIADAILLLMDHAKDPQLRERARARVEERYNAASNYANLVENVIKLQSTYL